LFPSFLGEVDDHLSGLTLKDLKQCLNNQDPDIEKIKSLLSGLNLGDGSGDALAKLKFLSELKDSPVLKTADIIQKNELVMQALEARDDSKCLLRSRSIVFHPVFANSIDGDWKASQKQCNIQCDI
jgi:hypothetical protein